MLVLLHAAELRSDERAAAPSAVAELFGVLHLPRPKNERQHLIQLRQKKLVMQPTPGKWAVTPLGLQEIGRLVEGVSASDLEKIGEEIGEPVFAGAAHHRIPPSMAPAFFAEGISRFQREHPTDRNVFMMCRYPRENDFSLHPAIDITRLTLESLGFEAHLASDGAVHDQLFSNVGVYLWSCNFGVAILEERGNALNYNVVLETGAMLMTGRRCLLLKDKTVRKLPSDLITHIHKEVDLDDLNTVRNAIEEWTRADLGVG